MGIRFLLNGTEVEAEGGPTTTLLDWLREVRGLTGTKEGCNEGDCGACTVMVTDARGSRALNACILFLPQLQGRAVRTVEGIAGPDGTPHPVQTALVERHGSQCGFCTPGFVVTMAAAHLAGRTDHATELAGNLCRCTGYAPILRAARDAETAPVPDWMHADAEALAGTPPAKPDAAPLFVPEISSGGKAAAGREGGGQPPFLPSGADALAEWYLAHPEGTLIAGATDVGLWVTKEFRDLGPVAFLAGCDDLRGVEIGADAIRIGAATTIADCETALAPLHPALGTLLRRYGSVQVRGAATIGGNIANASPVGDGPPALIALGATLHLRRGTERRTMPLEDFFLDYGRQDRRAGEFVEAVSIPRQPDTLACHKVSKRFDQDISAALGAFAIAVGDGRVTGARVAFGGMAAIPKRARAVEAALLGQAWDEATVARAAEAMGEDFAPISDLRASAAYRLEVARGLLWRVFHESAGRAADLHALEPVAP